MWSADPDDEAYSTQIDLAKRLYQATLKSAEVTWEKGLLLKGNGLCHGISGNGLLLHTMARWHKKQPEEFEQLLGLEQGGLEKVTSLYRVRSLMFARAMSLRSI